MCKLNFFSYIPSFGGFDRFINITITITCISSYSVGVLLYLLMCLSSISISDKHYY